MTTRHRAPTWTADRDGLAHASHGSPVTHSRTICGLLTTDPRFGWPETERCPYCVAGLAAAKAGAAGATR